MHDGMFYACYGVSLHCMCPCWQGLSRLVLFATFLKHLISLLCIFLPRLLFSPCLTLIAEYWEENGFYDFYDGNVTLHIYYYYCYLFKLH